MFDSSQNATQNAANIASQNPAEHVRNPLLELIVGPTASGKSSAAVRRALEIGAEIISVDSVQVYRGLDIGSAKITKEEACGIPHHLIDAVDPDQSFTAVDFERLAGEAIRQIDQSGRPIILCGGTGLYLSALLYGLDYAEEEVDEAYRQFLNTCSLDQLLELSRSTEYRGLSLDGVDVANKRRLIRALEIFRSTGKSVGKFEDKRSPRFPCRWTVLDPPREELHRRIVRRVDQMLEQGLLEETEGLIRRYGREQKSLMSIGYREAGQFLAGEITREAMREAIIISTRQYAKRQSTWFRKYAGHR
ncbi:MAG: tRNA (adenosine(37)-N6)-dimethylallyltransferase MiaA [Bacillota bacterium]|nr:tRNA (adenosine(37)-N6)-dimethylallyltransferase MiaA [Bacillota bacterium]